MGVLIPDLDFFWNDPPSLAVRIPKAVADALKVSNGTRAEIRIENGTLVLRPILKPARKPRYTTFRRRSRGPQRGNEGHGEVAASCPDTGGSHVAIPDSDQLRCSN
jgi:virulence-associated protein VagC